jgi:hypothetical protein
MDMCLQIVDTSRLHWVLLRVIGFRELILDIYLTVDLVYLSTFLLLSIIPTKSRWRPLFPDEIPINRGKLPFSSETIHIYLMGLESIENLCSCIAITNTPTVGKHGISGDSFL